MTGRMLAIDYGRERIGLALSDPLGMIATPFGVLANDANAPAEVKKLVEQERVISIVVGMPFTLNGERGDTARDVESFVELLEQQGIGPIVLWDERFTTAIARKSMIELGTKKKTRREDKGRVDAMAAAVLLQSYLDSPRRTGEK